MHLNMLTVEAYTEDSLTKSSTTTYSQFIRRQKFSHRGAELAAKDYFYAESSRSQMHDFCVPSDTKYPRNRIIISKSFGSSSIGASFKI